MTPGAKLPPVSTTPATNLPPVSTTPAANFATSFTSVVDTSGKQWEQYQAENTLKLTWRQKFIYMLSLLSKGVPTKLLTFFFLRIFLFSTFSTKSYEYLREFWENSRRYSQVKVHHWYQQHWRQICHRYQRHRRQILPPVSLVLLTPVADNGNTIRLQIT